MIRVILGYGLFLTLVLLLLADHALEPRTSAATELLRTFLTYAKG